MHAGYRTQSGHAAFSASAAKPWESGQRPRTLQPEEMPWARGRAAISLQKTLSVTNRILSKTMGAGLSDSSMMEALNRQHDSNASAASAASNAHADNAAGQFADSRSEVQASLPSDSACFQVLTVSYRHGPIIMSICTGVCMSKICSTGQTV